MKIAIKLLVNAMHVKTSTKGSAMGSMMGGCVLV